MNKIAAFIYFFFFSLIAKSQTADFTYSTTNGLFCNPSTIQFTQTATGNPTGFVWDFGNNSGTNEPNPTITFNKAGSITATIGYDRNYICKPGDINFTGSSSGNISNYNWDFGDGSGMVNTNAKNITHNFASLGTYDVTLIATDISGCFDSNRTVIKVQVPPFNGTRSPSTGCVPANVAFTANDSIPANSSVTNYLWDFGDGSPGISTITTTTNHTYINPGNYSPKVTITTSEGCVNSYQLGGVAYGTPPFNEIGYPAKSVICGSDSANLISKATNANSYRWNFGDGKTAKVLDTITRHKYTTLGVKNITVTPAYNDCLGNPVTFQINVVGVIAIYHYTNSCSDKKTFSFTNTSQGNLSTISWDFGDGSPAVNTLNTIHTFPQSGSFLTRLTVTDSVTGCSDTYSETIYTSNPDLINPDTSICKNTSTTFSLVNNYNNSSATYTWHVAGQVAGPLEDSSFITNATLFGNFNNYVIINNGSGYCQDTIRLTHPLLVRGPDLSFTAPASLCLTDSFAVINSSKPYIPSDSVIFWYWNYGINNLNDSTYQPQPFVYSSPGGYKVKLTGIDINGCKDTLVKTVIIHPLPFLYPIPAIDTLCAGNADTLFAFHSDNIKWSPSNSLTCATCDTVLTTASASTKYYVTATSKFGCITTDSISVQVFPPFTAVPFLTDPYICLNDTIHLNVNPPGKKIEWSPTAGISNPNGYGPVAAPSQTTTYTAKLTDSVGCFTSSVSINVHVKSLPTVDAGPDQFYPYNASFTINPAYSNNVNSYNWTPSNLLSCTTCPFPGGIATRSAMYIIQVTSDSGCIAKDSVKILVECKDAYLLMPNAFTPNNDNLNDYFYPLTRGVQSIIRFSIYDRFGNLVFEARNFIPNDKAFGWNGRVSGADQSTGVFVYYLEALCDSGEKLYKKGSVVLIR
jgi:gliding motility-associated-like protein